MFLFQPRSFSAPKSFLYTLSLDELLEVACSTLNIPVDDSHSTLLAIEKWDRLDVKSYLSTEKFTVLPSFVNNVSVSGLKCSELDPSSSSPWIRAYASSSLNLFGSLTKGAAGSSRLD
jgi:hypothetical protein